MLYYLIEYIIENTNSYFLSLLNYLSFRSALTLLFAIAISLVFGKFMINFLKKKQVGESVRKLGLDGQNEKEGTPTMGGIIIILSTLIPVLLFAKIDNIYIIMLIVTTLVMGALGFADDYIKVFKKNKNGISGKTKIFVQGILGTFIGAVMFFSPDVSIKEIIIEKENIPLEERVKTARLSETENHSTKTTIPFVKNNEFDYAILLKPFTENYAALAWLIFIPIITFIIVAMSNGANLTDGIDGLAAGTTAIQAAVLGVFAWISGNVIFASYFNIIYISDIGELVVFIAAFIGSLIGFLWFNTYPAQIFMGDTGSLTLGGIIAVLAVAMRKELLIPIIAGIFLIENLSVIIQVSYFRYTKKKYGEGRRFFLMSPIHHHYQKKGIHESKIVLRFFILGLFLAVLSFIILKLR